MSGGRQTFTCTSRLAAALVALATLNPEDERSRLAILARLGIQSAKASGALPVDHKGKFAKSKIDDDEESNRPRPNSKRISPADEPPPITPSELIEYDDEDAAPAPKWLDETPIIPLPDKVSNPFSEPLPPLLAPNFSRAIISRMAAQPLPIGEIDQDKILHQTERSRPFQSLPRRLLPSLAQGLQLLIDTHQGMQPFGLDVRHLTSEIKRTVGWNSVEVLRFKGFPEWGVQRHPLKADEPYRPPAYGRPVLIVTDLGIGAGETTDPVPGIAVWRDFVGRLKRAGGRAIFLIPYARRHWPKGAPSEATLLVWDRTTTASSLGRRHHTESPVDTDNAQIVFAHPRLEAIPSDILRLATLASLATRIELQLLRRLRLELAADIDVGAEARLWHSELVQERAPTGIVLDPDIRGLLQRRLAHLPPLAEESYRIVREVHRRSAPALQLEEQLAYHVLKGDIAKAQDLLRSMVATLVTPGREGFSRWAGQAVLRIPPGLKAYEETQLLAAGAALRLGESAPLTDMPEGSGGNLQWLMPNREETDIALNLRQGAVEFGPRTMTASHRIRVSNLPTVLIELVWLDEDVNMQNQFLRIQPGHRRIYEIQSDELELNVVGGRRYHLAAANKRRQESTQHTLDRMRTPRVRITYDIEVGDEIKMIELPFVVGVLANLSGNSASLPDFKQRKFNDIDADNFDALMAAIQPSLKFIVSDIIDETEEDIVVELTFLSMEHFYPEYVVEQIPTLKPLLRQRNRLTLLPSMMEVNAAVHRVVERLIDVAEPRIKKMKVSPETAGRDAKQAMASILIDEFDQIKKHTKVEPTDLEVIQQALQTMVDLSHYFVDAKYEDSFAAIDGLIKKIDDRLSAQLTAILHHPDFQSLEATWRGLYYFVANTETSERLKIRVMNASKKDLLKDFEKAPEFDQSTLFKKVYEEEFSMFGGAPYGALIGDYEFSHHPQDLTLLEELSHVAAAAHAPFISAADPRLFGMDSYSELGNSRDLAEMFQNVEYAKWRSFRDSEDSRYVVLTLPHVLGRLPYGKASIPVESFDFEEEVDGNHHSKYLWTNAAWALGSRLTGAFAKYSWCAAIRGVEGGGLVSGLPTHTFKTDEGDVALKCPTEIAITDRREKELADLGFVPLTHCQGTDYAAFFSTHTVNKPKVYDTDWANVNARQSSQLQYILAVSRFAHYLKAMMRDKIGSFMTRKDVEDFLNSWISNYVLQDDYSGQEAKAMHPLRDARVDVEEIHGKPGVYRAVAFLKPHFHLDELTVNLRLVTDLPPPAKG